MNFILSKAENFLISLLFISIFSTVASATIHKSSITTLEIGNIKDQVNNFWGHGDTKLFEEDGVTYVLDSGYGLLHLNKIDLATGDTIAVGNVIDQVNGIWGDKFEVFKHNGQWYILDIGCGLAHLNKFDPRTGETIAVGNLVDKVNNFWGVSLKVFNDNGQWYIMDMGYGLAHLNKFDPETGETTAVGNLVDKVNNFWGNTFDVYEYENEWYVIDTGAGLAHMNKFDPKTGETTAVGAMEDQVNHFWGDWDIKVVHDGDSWCIIDTAAGLLHANKFDPATGKTTIGYDIADHVNYIWGVQFDTMKKDGVLYVFDVGAGLGHLNKINCDRCTTKIKTSVSGLVFYDQNFNHMHDAGEIGVAGISITLIDANANDHTILTNVLGDYTFYNIPPGEATILIDVNSLPLNTELTTGDNPTAIEVLPNVMNDAGIDGYTEKI